MTTADEMRTGATTEPRSGSAETPQALAAGARARAAAAAEVLGLSVQEVHTAQEARDLVDVLNRVWSVEDQGADVVDLGTVVALAHSGNYVTQAHLGGRLIGGGIGFFGPPGAPFHSHIVGVASSAAAQGVGMALKLHQGAWCLSHGTTRMKWTYDPLVARNAHFNIRKLGALPTSYHENFYGEMSDGINTGQFTDRMLIGWDLAWPPAQPGGPTARAHGIRRVVSLAATDGAPGRFAPPPPEHDGDVLVGIPRDIEAIRRRDSALAAEWRLVTREAFGTLLHDGWRVYDFRAGHYIFERERER